MCKDHWAGKKYSGSHTTAIEAAHRILRAAEANPLISKIALGIITSVGNGNLDLRIMVIPAGLKLRVRGPRYIQEIYLYTSQPEKTKDWLEKLWSDNGKQTGDPQPWNPKMNDGWDKKPWSKWNKKKRHK